MRQDEIIVTCIDKAPGKHQQDHAPYEYFKQVIMSGKVNACQVAFYKIPPQKSNYPYHYHTNVTEVFYIISGTGVLKTLDGERAIKAGDAVFCPPYEKDAHKITNTSETELLVYLDVDTVNDTDIAFYPDSNNVGVLAHGHYAAFFRKEDETPYYTGGMPLCRNTLQHSLVHLP